VQMVKPQSWHFPHNLNYPIFPRNLGNMNYWWKLVRTKVIKCSASMKGSFKTAPAKNVAADSNFIVQRAQSYSACGSVIPRYKIFISSSIKISES